MPTGISFSPDKMPDLSGKVILVTGGTAGLGAATVLHLAKHSHPPAHIYISGRNAQRADELVKQLSASNSTARVSFLPCDLASLSSVNEAAETILSQESRLDILMCNAGIMAQPPSLTKDGYEVQFGTNHLGHALLIRKCLPLLQRTAEQQEQSDARIIILTSLGFRGHPSGGIVFSALKTVQQFHAFGFGPWIRYGQSKLANILYARELARRYPAITCVSIHPGVVSTGLVDNQTRGNRAFVYVTTIGKMVKPAEGAYNQLWAATASKEELVNGGFYEPVGVPGKLYRAAGDDALAGRLWEWTEEALGEYISRAPEVG
ncbi:hypothetical protein CNMCM6936_006625 [Aspergillus lentulus]|uniref:Oxidoreductase n=1 Tax=Aspergillus lentulus TaxID=293939 RepID=A0AAN5YS69_ASPLE|nr:hypothetical protein CNMCM6069_007735 [Aspergillus lentulus]KAF4166315.1 hypothetical protein CNMCM6936_006625 [Aspergillus lentulus]KAF4175381.1 hypothetical protein CNMCM8060_007316 [Aspergillus lentulus]KAF4184608.1 hypothetical protein CNMCM7927_007767 [Aspergillus lentulus]KAF4194765.1 hypothetical protein CNMCM8694_007126 [Aspergillus lentulus]